MIQRRHFLAGGLATLALNAQAQTLTASVVILHGKQGMPQSPALQEFASALGAKGLRTDLPTMPWARTRYIEGDAASAFDEISARLDVARKNGATRVFLAGHSIGATAALGFAVARGGVDGIAMLGTGHVPAFYYAGQGPANAAIRADIERARTLRAAGQGRSVAEFSDNNQGQALRVQMTADAYLTYFEPGGVMDAAAQMPHAPCPVLWAIGQKDSLYSVSRTHYFDRLPPDPRHAFFEADTDHRGIPVAAKIRAADFFAGLSAIRT